MIAMTKIKLIKSVIVALLCAPALAFCNTLPPVVAYVVGAGSYPDGSIYIFFDRTISSCKSAGRLDLPASHPALKIVFGIAVTAFTSGSAVRIHPGSCAGSEPVFSSEGDSYFYLTKDLPT